MTDTRFTIDHPAGLRMHFDSMLDAVEQVMREYSPAAVEPPPAGGVFILRDRVQGVRYVLTRTDDFGGCVKVAAA